MKTKLGNYFNKNDYNILRAEILNHNIMPSMRLLQFSGIPVENTNVCAYNCAFISPKNIKDFSEIMYILMCGTGVGFSIDKEVVSNFNKIKIQSNNIRNYIICDNKEGWCNAVYVGIKEWYNGNEISFDFSNLRKKGSSLNTMGGKSSGYLSLELLLQFIKKKILKKQNSKLSSINIYDIICKIGETVVSGGVRRSAMISLSDIEDKDMRHAKTGNFFYVHPYRSVTNNSAIYKKKPGNKEFLEEWLSLINSKTGERGIFNLESAIKTMPKRRIRLLKKLKKYKNGVLTTNLGTNPCGEIILQNKQFCNLTEVIARPSDTKQILLYKIRMATILGTYQASLTLFPYLSKQWEQNCCNECLLGVSITGQWDCVEVRKPSVLKSMKYASIGVNAKFAKKININRSMAITCVKPSGTVSQMVDASPGIHARFSEYYIRRVRISSSDSLFDLLKTQGISYNPEVGQNYNNANTFVLDFPISSPNKSILQHHLSAIKQLNYWKIVKKNYTEHNPSITILVKKNEWISVLAWLDKNWDIVGGISFLPSNDHVYKLPVYENICKNKYHKLSKKTKPINFIKLKNFENKDNVDVKKAIGCDGCKII